MKVCRNIRSLNQFHFAQDLRFFSKIPDSNWDSKRFVLDSSWCRAPRMKTCKNPYIYEDGLLLSASEVLNYGQFRVI